MKLDLALKSVKALLSKVKMTQEPLSDGSLIQYDTEEIEQGEPVYMCDGAGDFSILPDGDFITKSQVSFKIEAGKVSAVNKIGEIVTKSGPQKQAQAAEMVVELSGSGKTEAHDINLPGAGAPDSLLNPELINQDDSYSTCMQKLNELHAQHSHVSGAHDKLRVEHDALNAKHNALVGRFDEMLTKINKLSADIKKANDDKELMSKQIDVLNRKPAGTAIEEVKTKFSAAIDNKTEESFAYRLLNS